MSSGFHVFDNQLMTKCKNISLLIFHTNGFILWKPSLKYLQNRNFCTFMIFFFRFSGLKRNNSVVGICEGYFFELTSSERNEHYEIDSFHSNVPKWKIKKESGKHNVLIYICIYIYIHVLISIGWTLILVILGLQANKSISFLLWICRVLCHILGMGQWTCLELYR